MQTVQHVSSCCCFSSSELFRFSAAVWKFALSVDVGLRGQVAKVNHKAQRQIEQKQNQGSEGSFYSKLNKAGNQKMKKGKTCQKQSWLSFFLILHPQAKTFIFEEQ